MVFILQVLRLQCPRSAIPFGYSASYISTAKTTNSTTLKPAAGYVVSTQRSGGRVQVRDHGSREMYFALGLGRVVRFLHSPAFETTSSHGHAKIAKMLLDAGEDVVRILIEAASSGAAVNLKYYGNTALDRALRLGRTRIVQMLLEAEATPDPTS
jgi:hypothetical protein